MSDILDHYKNYYANGGLYRLEDYKGSSRHLMIEKWLREHVPAGSKVLDIGCGDGSYSHWIPEYSWVGMDINEETQMFNGTRLTHDLESVPYPLEDGTFDAIICSEVLEHLFNPEKVHREAKRLLKSGGKYIISTPNFDWAEHYLGHFRQVVYNSEETHLREHIRFYTFETHEKMLSKEGFKVVDATGADTQFGKLFLSARIYLKEQVFKDKPLGEVDYIIGRMFPMLCHTIGIMSVKR